MYVCDKLIKLNNGVVMPAVGLGTYRIRGKELIYKVVDESLKAGYRLFDTAAVYGNEADIGFALKELLPKYNLKRSDIFITTKLAPSNHGGGEKTEKSVIESLNNLQTDYVDLYLIHWPGVSGVAVHDESIPELRAKSWNTLVKLYKKGLFKAIGVSNYTIRHLTELIKSSPEVLPAVNQVEYHPHYSQVDLKRFCDKHNIAIQAYSSLGSSDSKALLNDAIIKQVASKLNVSPAQVLLRWALHHNVAIIPKASSAAHINNNFQLEFEIPQEDVELIDSLGEKSHKYTWNPDTVN